RFAANDDRRTEYLSAGRRPSRLIYPIAAVVSILWAIVVIGYGLSTVGSGALGAEASLLEGPHFANLLLALFLPIGFIWSFAVLTVRSQEMRAVSRSIADLASKLSEPENVATESVINVSQAIRREISAVGDGI